MKLMYLNDSTLLLTVSTQMKWFSINIVKCFLPYCVMISCLFTAARVKILHTSPSQNFPLLRMTPASNFTESHHFVIIF